MDNHGTIWLVVESHRTFRGTVESSRAIGRGFSLGELSKLFPLIGMDRFRDGPCTLRIGGGKARNEGLPFA